MSDFSLLIQLHFLQYALDFQIISASSSFPFNFSKKHHQYMNVRKKMTNIPSLEKHAPSAITETRRGLKNTLETVKH